MIYSFASKLYKGLTVCYSYIAESAQPSYDSFGTFNGGTPSFFEITIEDVRVAEVSIIDYISHLILESLQDEIAEQIERSR